MIFILANNSTYNRLYSAEHFRYPRLLCHTDLLGYGKVRVRVHTSWELSHGHGNVGFLEEQLEALADFGYIKLEYMDEEGHIDQYFTSGDNNE